VYSVNSRRGLVLVRAAQALNSTRPRDRGRCEGSPARRTDGPAARSSRQPQTDRARAADGDHLVRADPTGLPAQTSATGNCGHVGRQHVVGEVVLLRSPRRSLVGEATTGSRPRRAARSQITVEEPEGRFALSIRFWKAPVQRLHAFVSSWIETVRPWVPPSIYRSQFYIIRNSGQKANNAAVFQCVAISTWSVRTMRRRSTVGVTYAQSRRRPYRGLGPRGDL